MAKSWKEIQEQLIFLGYDLGPDGADGYPGQYTKAAVSAFKEANGLPNVYPGTVGPKTLAALFPDEKQDPPALIVATPWIAVGLEKRGLMETGKDKPELVKFLKSDGESVGDPAKIPWCGDFVQTCLALTLPNEPLPRNPYWARNWGKWGVECKPTFGAVVVFSRGSAGHVAFIMGESRNQANWIILGGNQSNRISVVAKSKENTLAIRWPATLALPTVRLPRTDVGGALSIDEA
jgi:uncharacterized protein (TIGR02594 family)